MSREFAITPSAPAVSLDSSGRGEVTFTVSNTTALPMRARATLRGSSGLDGAWLKLRGSQARDMPPGSTETFTVDIQVPPGTLAGSHALSLVVVDVELPDEHYTESPKVAVEVRAPAPVEARAFPWWWVVLGAVLVAGLAFGAYTLLRDGGPEPAPEVSLAGHGEPCGPERSCVPGLSCVQDVCQCPEDGTWCDDQCVDPRSSDAHCGECNNSCPQDFACREGACVRVGCPPGETLCGNRCFDTQTNDTHCGECNNSCPQDFACQSGSCVRVNCAPALTLCGNHCVNIQINRTHCGGCNNSCGSGEFCRNGTCIPGLTPNDRCGAGEEPCRCPGSLLSRCVPLGTCTCPEQP